MRSFLERQATERMQALGRTGKTPQSELTDCSTPLKSVPLEKSASLEECELDRFPQREKDLPLTEDEQKRVDIAIR